MLTTQHTRRLIRIAPLSRHVEEPFRSSRSIHRRFCSEIIRSLKSMSAFKGPTPSLPAGSALLVTKSHQVPMGRERWISFCLPRKVPSEGSAREVAAMAPPARGRPRPPIDLQRRGDCRPPADVCLL